MKTALTFVVTLCMSLAMIAQSAKETPQPKGLNLSSEDQLSFRNLQVEAQNLIIQKQGLAEQSRQIDQKIVDTQQKMQAAYQALLAKHKLDPKTHTLCDGPQAGQSVCSDVKAGEIAVRELPEKTEQAKK